MRLTWLGLLVLTTNFGCNGEHATDTGDGDADTDTDADSDTDADADLDGTIDGATSFTLDTTNSYVFTKDDDLNTAGDRDFYSFTAEQGVDYAVYAGTKDGTGDPDTVIRVYGPDKAQIGEDDDLPFRINGTDAGYVFRARETGTYYAEVLEWADWNGDTPAGGSNFDYTFSAGLAGYEMTEGVSGDPVDNDSIEMEKKNLDSLSDTDTTNDQYSWFLDPFDGFMASDSGYYFMTGSLDTADDADFFGFRVDTTDTTTGDFAPGYVTFSQMPGLDTNLDAVYTLFDGDGVELASSDSPEVLPEGLGVGYDVGINYLVLEPTDLYLQVTSATTISGAFAWYAIIAEQSSFNLDVVTIHDTPEAVETDYTDATEATMTASTSTPGLYYGFLAGRLDTVDDAFDSFHLTGGIVAGQNIYVDCGSEGYATAARINIEIKDSNGNVIDHADKRSGHDDDPLIEAIALPSNVTSDVYVIINRDSGSVAAGRDASYQCFVSTSDPA